MWSFRDAPCATNIFFKKDPLGFHRRWEPPEKNPSGHQPKIGPLKNNRGKQRGKQLEVSPQKDQRNKKYQFGARFLIANQKSYKIPWAQFLVGALSEKILCIHGKKNVLTFFFFIDSRKRNLTFVFLSFGEGLRLGIHLDEAYNSYPRLKKPRVAIIRFADGWNLRN